MPRFKNLESSVLALAILGFSATSVSAIDHLRVR